MTINKNDVRPKIFGTLTEYGPLTTAGIHEKLNPPFERHELYDFLLELESEDQLERKMGLDGNGHTLCINWILPETITEGNNDK